MVQYNQNANCPISVYNLAPSRVEDLDSQIKKKRIRPVEPGWKVGETYHGGTMVMEILMVFIALRAHIWVH